MNSSDEFTSPIATSTVWKKKKPQGWVEEPDNTFQELCEQSGTSSMNDKENIDNINSTIIKDDGAGNVIASSETTLNLWKYIVPPHPGELEEDSFISDNMIYNASVGTTNDAERVELSHEIANELDGLVVLAKELTVEDPSLENKKSPNSAPEDDFVPIPGYIITDSNVIMRRHSSTNAHVEVASSVDSRKILSAPSSMAILHEVKHCDAELDAEVAALTFKLEKHANDVFDCINVEEDLINESLSNYFKDGPEIGSSQDLSVALSVKAEEVFSNQNIEVEKTKKMHEQLEADSPIDNNLLQVDVFLGNASTPNAVGSLNTVPFIDPENSMTTETLETPECLNETEMKISALIKNQDNSRLDKLNIVTQIEECANSLDQDGGPEENIVLTIGNSNLSKNIESGDENISTDITKSDTVNVSNEAKNISHEESDCKDNEIKENLAESHVNDSIDMYAPDSNLSPEVNLNSSPEVRHHHSIIDRILKDDYVPTPCAVGITSKVPLTIENKENIRHPSSNSSPEVRHHHSILDRILKDDYVPDKQIVIPPTYTVDQPCAVGITRKFPLTIENKTDLWVQCNISIDEVGKINGFSSQNRLIVPPLAEESLPVCLSAKQDGLCLGTVELTVNSVISGMLPEQYHSCKITAIAELPGLSMLPKEIKFGIQVENKEASYELTNSSNYELPLKVVLHSEGLDEVFSLSDPMSKYPTAVFALVLPPEQSFVGYIEFCPYEQYDLCEASLRVYVDCPNGALLAETSVIGAVGHYKLRIPTSKHSLAFHTSPGDPVSTDINLLNTGNMETTVSLSVSRPFTVSPPFISSLVPGEEATCQVSYFPVVTEHVSGNLTLSLAEDAVLYRIPIEGRSTKNKTKTANVAAPYTLMASKSIVNFGGSEIGRQKEDSILLQNDSPTQLMCLVLRVISPSRSFYILNEDSITLSCDIVLPAGSSQTLKLGYTPLHTEQHHGELLVKSKNKDVSFNIPLSGHGGLSQVSVLNAQQTSSRLWVDMGDITPNTRNTARITLHNTGSRAAFVSGVLEDEEGYPLPSNLAWINPTSFVIPDNASRELFVIYEAGAEKERAASVNRIALLKLYCGDEVARTRFCKVLKILDRPVEEQELPFDPTVNYLTPGDMKREGEVKLPHLTEGDMVFERQLFGSGLYQLFISVMGRRGGTQRKSLVPLNRQEVSARSRNSTSASSSSISNIPNESEILAPLKTREKDTYVKSPKLSKKKENQKPPCWTFSVDELKFTKPTVFHVVNESHESLVYEVSYEGTLYDVMPKAGCIPPCGCTEISIRPRVLTSPFISTLLVTAGGSERNLKLSYTPAQSDKLADVKPRLSAGSVNKSITIQDKVSFQTIPINTSCSSFFEFTNSHNDVIQWRLSSVAPAYRKVENSEPIRVPYSSFCVDVVSGVTPIGSREKIPLTFYPKHVGDFTQCWTFVYSRSSFKSAKQNHRVIFEGTATTCSARSASALSSHRPTSSSRPKDRVFIKLSNLDFSTPINTCQTLSFKLGNPLKSASKVKLSTLHPPFYLKYKEVLVEAGHSARIPIKYKPTLYGEFREYLQIDTDHGVLTLELKGTVTGPSA